MVKVYTKRGLQEPGYSPYLTLIEPGIGGTQDSNFISSILQSTHSSLVSTVLFLSRNQFFLPMSYIRHKPESCKVLPITFCYIRVWFWCTDISLITLKQWGLTAFCSHSALVRQCEALTTHILGASEVPRGAKETYQQVKIRSFFMIALIFSLLHNKALQGTKRTNSLLAIPQPNC